VPDGEVEEVIADAPLWDAAEEDAAKNRIIDEMLKEKDEQSESAEDQIQSEPKKVSQSVSPDKATDAEGMELDKGGPSGTDATKDSADEESGEGSTTYNEDRKPSIFDDWYWMYEGNVQTALDELERMSRVYTRYYRNQYDDEPAFQGPTALARFDPGVSLGFWYPPSCRVELEDVVDEE
jgi:hypothetical protein